MFPVEEKIGEIAAALRDNRSVVLTAPPGSGKTTCVPPALLDEPWLAGRKIVMLEPRRLAARNCAAYVARKRGEPVGETVGYQVRLERKVSAATRLEIVTEGLLAQRILSDPELADTGLVIFDEFHERSLACDLAFALALDVRRALRPDLRVLVMSATLDADEVAAHLAETVGATAVVRAEGRMFPVETRYLGADSSMPAAIARALRETEGDVLCFLPGEGEIRRCLASCASLRSDGDVASPGSAQSRRASSRVDVLPLYGSLPKEEQDKVFRRPQPASRKVVLATSIAETSVTLEGVTAVVDSGLMRVPRFSPGTGMTGLVTLPLTRDRAEQRRGRAGRVRAGICYRLWSEASDASRPAKSMPEILDADLASLVLSCASWGALAADDLPWMTPPPASAWDQARSLLTMLGAFDARGQLTDRGRAMARLAMHPRLAAMCLGEGGEVERWGGGSSWTRLSQSRHADKRTSSYDAMETIASTAALLAAIVEEGGKTRETDIRKILDLVRETPNRPDSRRILQLAKRFSAVSPIKNREATGEATSSSLREVRQNSPKPPTSNLQPSTCSEGALLALAYPDRVAKNRGNATFQMVSGRGAFLDPTDALARSPYLVCCELDDRPGDAKVFLGCPIDEEEIEELFADKIVEEPFCAWDRVNERVKSVIRRKLGAMTLREVSRAEPLRHGVATAPLRAGGIESHTEPLRHGEDLAARTVRALIDGVRQKGVANLPCWTKESLQLRARVAFLHRVFGGLIEPALPVGSRTTSVMSLRGWPALTDEEILAALPGFVSGMTKWRDLEKVDMFAVIDFILANPSNLQPQPSTSNLQPSTSNLQPSTSNLHPPSHDRRELDRLAPTRMEVPSGSHMLIHYEGDEPTCEVRLQECFGLMETPKVAGGRVPVVMTLLSPAQRPIQVTKDLAGFWRGAYQLVRKDMRGRYPKHYWPEDPLTAVATRRTVRGPAKR